jgi:hypothetical protein
MGRSFPYTTFVTVSLVRSSKCKPELQLRGCLLQARNLKILHLQADNLTCKSDGDYQDGPVNLPFRDGDQFPILEELCLDLVLRDYFPTADNCQVWSRCMNWSYLITLDFGDGCPITLLAALTGLVPQLKVLNFGFWSGTLELRWQARYGIHVGTRERLSGA